MGVASAMDVSFSPTGTAEATLDRPSPIYLPTFENTDAYKTVVIERKVIVPPPAVPVKDAKAIELEVRKLLMIQRSLFYSLYGLFNRTCFTMSSSLTEVN